MKLLLGACEVCFLQGLALHTDSATALRLPLPSPEDSTCLCERQLVLRTDPAHCLSQTCWGFMALKRLPHQDWVKVSARATCCHGQMDRQHNLTSLLLVELKHLNGYLHLSPSRPGPTAAGLASTGDTKTDCLVFLRSSYLHP